MFLVAVFCTLPPFKFSFTSFTSFFFQLDIVYTVFLKIILFFRAPFLSLIIMTRMTCKPFRIVAMSSHWTNSKLDQPIRNKDWRQRPQIQKRIPMTSITWPGLTTQWRKPCNFLPVFYYNLNVMKKKQNKKLCT